jgi:FSR family fosmidomycin resistance protein-like MFS transporter
MSERSRPEPARLSWRDLALGDRRQVLHIGLLSVAHLVHDSYLSMLGILMPLLMARLELSLFTAGLLGPIGQVASVLQPYLGYLNDRLNGRTFVVVFTAATGICMCLIGLAPNYAATAALLFAVGVSSAAYHPSASALLTQLSGRRWGGALAIYHLGGNLGLALGPILMTAVVVRYGLEASLLAALPAVAWALLLWRLLPAASARVRRAAGDSFLRLVRAESRTYSLLGLMIFAWSGGSGGFLLFLPTFLLERGSDYTTSAGIAAAFYAAGGLGALASGFLSDHVGRQRILIWALLLAPGFFLAFVYGNGWPAIAGLLLGAAILQGQQPVMIALVQELSPRHRGTAVGFVGGYQFLLGGLATAIVGALADRFGLATAFTCVALAPLIGVPAVAALRLRPPEAPAGPPTGESPTG